MARSSLIGQRELGNFEKSKSNRARPRIHVRRGIIHGEIATLDGRDRGEIVPSDNHLCRRRTRLTKNGDGDVSVGPDGVD